MRIKIDCDSCGHNFSVSNEFVGRRVRCTSCGEPVRVTDSGASAAAASSKRRKDSAKSVASPLPLPTSNNNGLAIGLGIGGGIVALGLIITAILLLRPQPQQNLVAANPAAPAPANSPMNHPLLSNPPASPSPPAGLGGGQSAEVVATPARSNIAEKPVIEPPAEEPVSVPDQPEPQEEAAKSDTPEEEPQVADTPDEVSPPPLSGVPEPSSEELKLPKLIVRVEPAVVRINVISEKGASTGSGFVVSNDGTVVTNYHVVTSAEKADVEFKDGTKGKVIGYRHLVPRSDIAIIQIDLPANKLKPVPLSSKLPQEGESVATFGAPHGLSFSKSEGVISAIRREADLKSEMGLDLKGTWLQTSAPISPGNSGGPLVDYYGRVVGMNTMQLASGQNLNFAVSSLEINRALTDAVSKKVKELRPEELRPYRKELTRKSVSEEVGTERGRRLFADVQEIFLISGASHKNYDPTNAIWARVVQRAQKAVEKSGIYLSLGEPAHDAAYLVVILEMKASRKKAAGTQEMRVLAELVCHDPHAKKDESPWVKVWKDEQDVGTVSLNSANNGNVSQTVYDNLTKFFTGFRGAYNRAVREQKEADARAKGADASEPASAGK